MSNTSGNLKSGAEKSSQIFVSFEEQLQLLFHCPREPIFLPKGKGKVHFQLPQQFIEKNYKELSLKLKNFTTAQNNSPKICVDDLNTLPDLELFAQVGPDDTFSFFIEKHREIASQLVQLFLSANQEELISMATFVRDRVNAKMFHFALSMAILNRPDSKKFSFPNLTLSLPELFVCPNVIAKAKMFVHVSQAIGSEPEKTLCFPKDFTASDSDYEHKIWYFREDIGVNLHHWHWHLVNPFAMPGLDNEMAIVNKDRRGELFYYMHHQVLARYNCERFCNEMNRVEPLQNLRLPIKEGYYSKLRNGSLANHQWPGRITNMKLSDVDRNRHFQNSVKASLNDFDRWRTNIEDAIKRGYAEDTKAGKVDLMNEKGIDVIGNMVEASILSPNPKLYGSYHNTGHMLIAYAHDPKEDLLEGMGVMGTVETAMRDPVFYRWHGHVNEIFMEHKDSLPPYSEESLTFKDVQVDSIEVITSGSSDENVLTTHFERSEINLSVGLDFNRKDGEEVHVSLIHLNHTPFVFKVKVTNKADFKKNATVRIFIAPTYNEQKKNFVSFDDHRNFFIELDKFKCQLDVGQNSISRKSEESNVTIPFQQAYDHMKPDPSSGTQKDQDAFAICGCGWPSNMLIPRGKPEGLACQLFVMITDSDEDQVEFMSENEKSCKDAFAYCGLRDEKYPDSKPMGYPFDRRSRSVSKSAKATTLKDFITPNMKVASVSIVHENAIDKCPTPSIPMSDEDDDDDDDMSDYNKGKKH